MAIRLDNSAQIRVPSGEPLWTWTDGSDSLGFYVSDGSPEGAITANVGSLALDASGGTSYRKATGSSNTGWVQADTNFFNTDFNATAPRTHHFDDNGLFMRGGTSAFNGALFTINQGLLYMLGGASGSNSGAISLDANGIDFAFGGSGDFKIDSDPGTSGQVITSNGPDVAPTWEDPAEAVNISRGTLLAAIDNRVVDFGSNDLTFNNLDQLTFNGGGLSVFTFDAAIVAIEHPGSGLGGRLALMDDDANRSVSWQAPATIPTSYTLTLPTAPPTENGQVLSFQTDGTAAFSTVSVVSRKYSADALGNITIAAAFDFDTGNYDNKSATVTGNVNTIVLSTTRAGYYSIKLKATGGPYTLQWGAVSFFDATPPSSIDTEEFLIELYYDSVDSVWHYIEPETNFFSKDFTATENRTHHLDSNGLFMRGGSSAFDGSLFTMNGATLYMLGGASGSNSGEISLNAEGIDFSFGGNGDLKLDGAVGTAGQVLSSNGPDLPPTWEDVAAVTNTNITTGSLTNATGAREVPMNSQNLSFNAMADLTMTGTTGSTFTFQTQDFIIDNPVSATPGAVTFQDGDNSHNVTVGAPAVTTESYTVTLPPASPTANKERMTFQSDGTATFTTTMVARIQTDFVITSGTTLNLVTGVDGDTNAHTVVGTGAVGTPTLSGFATQAEFAADFDTEIYFEGVALDKSGTTTGYAVTRESDTEISFNFDVPIDSLIYFKRRM